jgi:hypothetical protein
VHLNIISKFSHFILMYQQTACWHVISGH